MNTQHNLFRAISKNDAEQSATFTSEPATIEKNPVQTFTVADLWNIQRHKKAIVRRRYLS